MEIQVSTRKERSRLWMIRNRGIVMGIMFLITIALGFGIPRIKSDVNLGDLFAYDDPYFKVASEFAQLFGGAGSNVVIAVKVKNGDIFNQATLEKVKKITEEIELWDEVYRSQTRSIASRSTKTTRSGALGLIEVKPVMWPDVPNTAEDLDHLKKLVFSDPAIEGSLVSKNGTAAQISTAFRENISYERVFQMMESLTEGYSDANTSIQVIGFPMHMGWIYSLKHEMYLLFAISLGLMLLIIVVVFRSLMGSLPPFILGGVTTVMGLGFIGWSGINFSPLVYILAFFVGARKVSHGVQITCRYLEELNANGYDKEKACWETIKTMSMPNLAGVLSDGFGFTVLYMAKIVLMQQVAIIMSFWMMTIAAASLIPLLCSFFPLNEASDKLVQRRTKGDIFKRMTIGLGKISLDKRGRWLVVGSVAGLLILSFGQIDKIKIGDPNPGSPLLYEDHPYNQSQKLINEEFDASSETFCLFFDGNRCEAATEPIVFGTFDKFEQFMSETLPDIYRSSFSLATPIKMINVTYRDDDPLRYQLPTNPREYYNLLGMAATGLGGETLALFLDNQKIKTQTILFFADHTSDNILRVQDAAYDFFKKYPMKIKDGEFKLAGGSIGLELGLNKEMKRAHVQIDAMVVCAMFLMCSIFFRSFVAGAMLTLPLLIANIAAFAYMAHNDIGLSVNTLPVAAVGVGVGIDFALYLYGRCIDEFPRQKGWYETVMESVNTSGKAVIYTGFALVLPIIPWYFLSTMKFQAQMGFFLSMLMIINVLIALTLHPLLLITIKPKFISKTKKEQRTNVDQKFVSSP